MCDFSLKRYFIRNFLQTHIKFTFLTGATDERDLAQITHILAHWGSLTHRVKYQIWTFPMLCQIIKYFPQFMVFLFFPFFSTRSQVLLAEPKLYHQSSFWLHFSATPRRQNRKNLLVSTRNCIQYRISINQTSPFDLTFNLTFISHIYTINQGSEFNGGTSFNALPLTESQLYKGFGLTTLCK